MTSIDQWRQMVFFQKKKSKLFQLEQVFYDHFTRSNISCPCTPPLVYGLFPKILSDTLVPLFQPKGRDFMVIFLKLSSDTLVPLFQPKSRYYLVIFQNYHQTPWYSCFNLKVGIV